MRELFQKVMYLEVGFKHFQRCLSNLKLHQWCHKQSQMQSQPVSLVLITSCLKQSQMHSQLASLVFKSCHKQFQIESPPRSLVFKNWQVVLVQFQALLTVLKRYLKLSETPFQWIWKAASQNLKRSHTTWDSVDIL